MWHCQNRCETANKITGWGFFFFGGLHPAACGILVPHPGRDPVPPAMEDRFLTTRLSQKSLKLAVL